MPANDEMTIAIAVAVGGLLAFCAMVVFVAWLCVHGDGGKPKPSAPVLVHSKHTTPAQKLEEKFNQAAKDARRGDSFGSDDDDGDGDGGGGGGP
jgi:hypothetical protein